MADHATLDFETYSEAGFIWQGPSDKKPLGRWVAPAGSKDKGLPAVGARVYAEHPSTEVITMSYRLPGDVSRRWRPGAPPPILLFNWIRQGGLVEAHNAMFERLIWTFVCTVKYGWPMVPPEQWRCSAAKARAWGLPGALANMAKVLNLDTQKDAEGKRLIKLFSMPKDPGKADPSVRITRADRPEEAERFDAYCDTDVQAEMEGSARVPDLIPMELDYWQADQEVNLRGIGVDSPSVAACVSVLNQALAQYGEECREITDGIGPSQVTELVKWLGQRGVKMSGMDSDAVEAALERDDLTWECRRVLECRALVGSASVKKVYGMVNRVNRDGRLCDLFVYHGARTGRDTHADVQPGNLPKAGPSLRWCEDAACGKPFAAKKHTCPWCGASDAFSSGPSPWEARAVDHALNVMAHGSLQLVEEVFGDALLTISGCVRGLLVAGPGKDLICSDYTAIEAVVLAALAGEQWRLDTFAAGRSIYLDSASKITGTPVEEYEAYKKQHGSHHPDRQYVGKVAELALGYAGWLGAWRNFDSTDRFTDEQVKELIKEWRAASPAIVELWGGQTRGVPWNPQRFELFGLEGMAIAAILSPGQRFTYRMIGYEVFDDVLYCVLPSGRRIAYHQPRLGPGRYDGTYSISFMTWNSNPKYGAIGWIRMDTYAGRLAENVTQAVARDIMTNAVVNAERQGYPIVLRVHDELAAEVDQGFGSIDEFEGIMTNVPTWAQDWPIKAAGGWRGRRYRKD